MSQVAASVCMPTSAGWTLEISSGDETSTMFPRVPSSQAKPMVATTRWAIVDTGSSPPVWATGNP